jgi:enoyl-CoA hydratase/carnithine racemase
MISTEVRDGVSIVRLDRPDGRNALVPALAQTLARSALPGRRPGHLEA